MLSIVSRPSIICGTSGGAAAVAASFEEAAGNGFAAATVVVVEHERSDREGSAHDRDRDDDGHDPAARRRPRLGDHAGSPLGSVVPGAGMSSGSKVLSSSVVASA